MCPGYIVDICPNVAIFRFVTKGIVTSITGEISEAVSRVRGYHWISQNPVITCTSVNTVMILRVCVSVCGPVMELDSGYQARRQ